MKKQNISLFHNFNIQPDQTDLNRRDLLKMGALGAGALSTGLISLSQAKAEVGPNGLHVQDWFYEGFLELKDDFEMARDEGKTLAVIFEQAGCPYCREMHEVNFQRETIVNYANENFVFVQLDLWGSREVLDFDGEAMEERALARKWSANFTPTISFFPHDMDYDGGDEKSGKDLEKFRMPGYFKPFHFLAMLEFVHNGNWRDQNFQRFLQNRFDSYREQGKEIDVW